MGQRHRQKEDMHIAIRELEKMPRPSIMRPFREIAARKSTGTSIGDSVTDSSNYISLIAGECPQNVLRVFYQLEDSVKSISFAA
jgi:hypothetical protein